MDQDKFIALLYKQLQGEINLIEKTLLDKWLQEAAINRDLAQKIKEDWALSEQYSPELEVNVDEEYGLLQQRIKKLENINTVKGKIVPVKKRSHWWSYAAAVAMVIGLGTWLFVNQSVKTSPLVLSTNTKQQKEIQLADGTKVWLNEQSTFTYPKNFDGDSRRVSLKGEAFFEVHKDATKPFIIETATSTIKVLGTSFNVQALPATDYTEVIVKTGKVELSAQKANQSVILVANEKGIHQHQNNQLTKTAETDMNELAWNSRVLYFKNTPVPQVVESLERLFNVSIQTTDSSRHCLFTGRFPQPQLEDILTALKEEFKLTYNQLNTDSFHLSGGCVAGNE